jgi:hypothetical protein
MRPLDHTRTSAHRWFRQPLLHFLAMGALLFVLFEWTGNANDSSQAGQIIVDEDILLGYAQATNRALDIDNSQRLLNDLAEEQFHRLVADYVRQEVLYREAIAMGLQESDPDIRQRLIEKIELIQSNLTAPMREVQEQEIQQYYDAHRNDYQQAAQITFAHAFFDNRNGGKEAALQRAQGALTLLNQQRVPFSDGNKHGDAYHYQPNYVQRSQEMISKHFSQRMATELFALPVQAQRWSGPVESPYGQHVVLITHRSEAGLLALEQVRQQVTADLLRELARDSREQAINELIDSYEVDLRLKHTPGVAQRDNAATPGATP